MTESQPHADAAEDRYRCWETILTETGDKPLRAIDADLIMTAAVLGFSDRLLESRFPVELFTEDKLDSKKGMELQSAVNRINWLLNRSTKARATDPTESEEMQWKHGSVITGARGMAGTPFKERHKTPASYPKGSPVREFFEILKDTRTNEEPTPREGDIWGYQGRGAYTGYVVDGTGSTMTSTTRFNAPADKTRWVPKEYCEENKTWGLIAQKETLPPEKEPVIVVRNPDGTLERVDLGYGHGGMKQYDTTPRSEMSQETWQELSNDDRGLRMCGTGSGSGPSVLPEKLSGKSRLVGYTHGMIQAIYVCRARELKLGPELEALAELKEFAKNETLHSLDKLATFDKYKQLQEVKTFERLDTLQKYARWSREERSRMLELAENGMRYDGIPFEIAVGRHTTKLASCFPCTLFMYAADYPPSAIHLGRGESWLPFYPGKDKKSGNLLDTAITNTNKRWHSECRADLARGLGILATKRERVAPQHADRLGALEQYLGQYASGEQAANLILDAITVHDSETARINRTIKDPPE